MGKSMNLQGFKKIDKTVKSCVTLEQVETARTWVERLKISNHAKEIFFKGLFLQAFKIKLATYKIFDNVELQNDK